MTQNSETMKIEDRQTAVEPFVVIRLRTVGRVVRNCQIGRDLFFFLAIPKPCISVLRLLDTIGMGFQNNWYYAIFLD